MKNVLKPYEIYQAKAKIEMLRAQYVEAVKREDTETARIIAAQGKSLKLALEKDGQAAGDMELQVRSALL
jgi:protein-arginine kinase activator protein McsA